MISAERRLASCAKTSPTVLHPAGDDVADDHVEEGASAYSFRGVVFGRRCDRVVGSGIEVQTCAGAWGVKVTGSSSRPRKGEAAGGRRSWSAGTASARSGNRRKRV